MSIKVLKIDQKDRIKAYDIRTQVFVVEQKVPAIMEIDEHEEDSHHYLAFLNEDQPIGTARWRKTENGIKMERFAVLKEFRKKSVGSALMEKMLKDIIITKKPEELIYLHSQIGAMPLYEKFGFIKVGEEFEECGIKHFKMELKY